MMVAKDGLETRIDLERIRVLGGRMGPRAVRALELHGVSSLRDLSRLKETDILKGAGVGRGALAVIRQYAQEAGAWPPRDGIKYSTPGLTDRMKCVRLAHAIWPEAKYHLVEFQDRSNLSPSKCWQATCHGDGPWGQGQTQARAVSDLLAQLRRLAAWQHARLAKAIEQTS